MYSAAVRRRALDLIDNGSSLRSASMATGISRTTLREWRGHPEKAQAARSYRPRCGVDPVLPEPRADYAYLLGRYLGDGCISVGGNPAKEVWRLRIMCADAWPGLKKHLRRIELQPWQQTIVNEFPGEFVKGLFHSDGYRGMNRVRRVLADGEHWYEYPRYLFTNESPDIRGLCGAALDQLGVEWRFARRNVISVAKKGDVARWMSSRGRSTERERVGRRDGERV